MRRHSTPYHARMDSINQANFRSYTSRYASRLIDEFEEMMLAGEREREQEYVARRVGKNTILTSELVNQL